MAQIRAEEHLGLVRLCANRLAGRGVDYEDLYSAGCLGLVKAANAFDPSRGVCFSTYAVPVIMGEMRHLFRDSGTVHMGRRLYEQSIAANRAAEQLRQQLGTEPTVSQVAAAADMSESDTAQALSAAQPVISLTALTEDGAETRDIPVDSHESSVLGRIALEQVLSQLPSEDRRLIFLRYMENRTQSDTAALLGMTQVQVSRREKKILLFLRQKLES